MTVRYIIDFSANFINILVELSTHSRMPRLDIDLIFGNMVDDKLRQAFAVGRRESLLKETTVEPEFAGIFDGIDNLKLKITDCKLWTSFMCQQSLDELERRFMAAAQRITDGFEVWRFANGDFMIFSRQPPLPTNQ